MRKRNTKLEFLSLFAFMLVGVLLLTNGFAARITAQDDEVDVYQQIEPIGDVLHRIMQEYVREPELDRVVEGALIGMMRSLDRHSAYLSAQDLQGMREETRGEFEGIGISIKESDDGRIMVYTPITGSPAAEAGVEPFDIIVAIDDVPTEGMTLNEAADMIRGPRGTTVKLSVERRAKGDPNPEVVDLTVKRDKVPLESIKEARILDGGIGYIRISDFKDTTARDIEEKLEEFLDQGMRALVLDLRWNPGGLLTASKEVSELFLPKNSLVTYTRGRSAAEAGLAQNGKALPPSQAGGLVSGEDMELHTERKPVLPEGMPMVVLVNDQTASSSEIVTGALQYHQRAIIVGEKTFGKGSVQTVVVLPKPKNTALRLTTALYYTPQGVTIDHQGILPDVEEVMELEQERLLATQMYESYKDDPAKINQQNHGTVSGNEVTVKTKEDLDREKNLMAAVEEVHGEEAVELLQEFISRGGGAPRTIEDTQLKRAVEILQENPVWENLLVKYHRDVRETQIAATLSPEEELAEQHEDNLQMSIEMEMLELREQREDQQVDEMEPELVP